MRIQHSKPDCETQSLNIINSSEIPAYPIDMSSFLILPGCKFNTKGVPYHVDQRGYHAITITQYALAHWNSYLKTKEEQHRSIFLAQAQWLIENEVCINKDIGGWLISFPRPNAYTNESWLSALSQGSGLSVLVRAFWLTGDNAFFTVANRVVHSFEQDILDGGICTPIGKNGVFFEEVAVYPASHKLSGFIFSIFGLYDYVALTEDVSIQKHLQRSLTTMHHLLDEFDLGFWTCIDLQHRELSSPTHLTLQIELLEALAAYSGCNHCANLAERWRNYLYRLGSRLRLLVATSYASLSRAFLSRLRTALFPSFQPSCPMRICIPVISFPFTGGILTVLEGIAQVTKEFWDIEYLAQIIGPDSEKYLLHRFGTTKTAPWHFPLVWLYFFAGYRKLASILHQGTNYQVIMPQDGLFTAAFSTLVGKLAGVRVVCMDHSTLTWPRSRIYHAERAATVERKNWPWILRLFVLLMLKFYWPSISLLAYISSRYVDHFLIPGVYGDEIDEACKELGIHYSRVTRFNSMIDLDHYVLFEAELRNCMRKKKHIEANAIVVAIICRLAPEKGLDVAIESISKALSHCSPEIRTRVHIVIAGEGPLRTKLEEHIQQCKLNQNCVLWGEIPAPEVSSLLGISDVFLYTSVRGACFPMSVLEAMASSCAVIASTQPISNAHLLAEGRGIAVPAGDIEQTSAALIQLLNDPELCKRMGQLARNYISLQHSPSMFTRTLLRATYWSGLDKTLTEEAKTESVSIVRGKN